MSDLGLDDIAGLVGILDTRRRELGKLTVFEHHDIAGGIDKRDDIGGDIAPVSPAPTTIGESLRATAITPGSSAHTAARP